MMKSAITHTIAVYLGAGLFAGLLMQQAIPALNGLGVAYIAATWPNQIRCAKVSAGCNAVPDEWLAQYLFKANPQAGAGE